MRRLRNAKQSPRDEGRLLVKSIGCLQSVLTEEPEKSSTIHVAVFDVPWSQYLPVHLVTNPKVGVDVVSPINSAVFGNEVIIKLRVSVKSVCVRLRPPGATPTQQTA